MTKKDMTTLEARGVLSDLVSSDEYQEYAKQQELYYEIAHSLRKMREEKKFTQAKLAEKMGVKQPTIARIEKTGRVSTGLLTKFCLATGSRLSFTN